MQEVLRWWCLWGVCLTAVKVAVSTTMEVKVMEDLNHFKLPELSMDSIFYPLHTNLTVKPLSSWWEFKIILSKYQSPPTVCISLEDGEAYVKLSMFNGDCITGDNVCVDYLSSPLKLQTSTTFNFTVTSDAVLLQDSQGGFVKLTGPGFTLPQNELIMKVMEELDVDTSLRCDADCPVHYQVSREPGKKEFITEWNQESFHSFFLPGPSFTSLHYERKCTTRENTVIKHEFELRLGKRFVPMKWHHLISQQEQNNATVRLNGKQLKATQLEESCILSNHTLWMVGEAFFSFNCTPKGAKQTPGETEGPADLPQPCVTNDPRVFVPVTITVILLLLCVVLVLILVKKRSWTKGGQITSNGNSKTDYI